MEQPEELDLEALATSLASSLTNEPCLACKAGMHGECQQWWDDMLDAGKDCCCQGDWMLDPGALPPGEDAEEHQGAYFEGFTGLKPLAEYADPLSTGRKEAVKVGGHLMGKRCQWAWLKNAGGGIIPIIGCTGRAAEALHHGPDKNTMRNILDDNLWAICAFCHNTWHALNDPFYGERPTTSDGKVDASAPFLPLPEYMDRLVQHDPITKATDDEVLEQERRRREEDRKHGRE